MENGILVPRKIREESLKNCEAFEGGTKFAPAWTNLLNFETQVRVFTETVYLIGCHWVDRSEYVRRLFTGVSNCDFAPPLKINEVAE